MRKIIDGNETLGMIKKKKKVKEPEKGHGGWKCGYWI
jgi:hypothetical protein